MFCRGLTVHNDFAVVHFHCLFENVQIFFVKLFTVLHENVFQLFKIHYTHFFLIFKLEKFYIIFDGKNENLFLHTKSIAIFSEFLLIVFIVFPIFLDDLYQICEHDHTRVCVETLFYDKPKFAYLIYVSLHRNVT